MLPVKIRRDPAPSRWKYRFERLKLTPSYRFMMRYGLPWSLVAALILGIVTNDGIQASVSRTATSLRTSFAERPELMLTELELTGVSDRLKDDVLRAANVKLPVSSLDIKVGDIRRRIDEVEAVKRSAVRVVPGGILQIEVQEREAAVAWRTNDGLFLVDEEGVLTGMLDGRADRADLPLIAGEGAETHVDEALLLLQTARPIRDRVRGLVRVGERRWDVVLDRNQKILLPEVAPNAALARVMALNAAEDIFGRDVLVVDMRDGRRPILRVSAYAIDELRRLRTKDEGEKT
jgi:cell division protein FtsQ